MRPILKPKKSTFKPEQSNSIRRFREEVKSRAEKRIADFLFTHQVDYRYEDIATWAETSEKKSSYEPDFYLPEYDIYLEHLGIDLAGEIAPWFSWSTEEYHEKIRWARDQFAATESMLIETYEFEHEAGNLDRLLRARLEHHGVELDRMEFEALVESAFDYDQREGGYSANSWTIFKMRNDSTSSQMVLRIS